MVFLLIVLLAQKVPTVKLSFEKFSEAFNKSIPIINQSSKSFKICKTPWISKEILTVRKIKERIYKNFLKNPKKIKKKKLERKGIE